VVAKIPECFNQFSRRGLSHACAISVLIRPQSRSSHRTWNPEGCFRQGLESRRWSRSGGLPNLIYSSSNASICRPGNCHFRVRHRASRQREMQRCSSSSSRLSLRPSKGQTRGIHDHPTAPTIGRPVGGKRLAELVPRSMHGVCKPEGS
jgi:hypothetical protein